MTFAKTYLTPAVALISIAAVASFAFAARAQVRPSISVAPTANTAAPTAVAGTATIGNPTPPALPVYPFSASLTLANSPQAVGPAGTAQLAISSIVLTNFDTTAQQVFIFAPLLNTGGACGSTVVGGTTPRMQVYVQPTQTLVIPYPTPLVFQGQQHNCIAAEVTTVLHGGSVEMDVVGFRQPN
jgi:hypothetical protein